MNTVFPKYSFVIPVYKSEKYLQECVDSIICQTMKDYEIILVDDGSPDNSGVLCDQIAREHACVKVIHQENQGASVARNTGLNIASGSYIAFLDSDDFWLYPEGLSDIDRLITPDTDVVLFASMDYNERNGRMAEDRYEYPAEMNTLEPQTCLHYMVTHDLLNMHSAKRIYRRAFLEEHHLCFRPGIRSEDVELGIRVANCLPNYRFLNKKLYVYRHHEDSVTTTIGEKHLREYQWIIENYADYTYRNDDVKELLLSYVSYQYSLLLAFVESIKPQSYKQIKKDLKKYTFLFRYTHYPRTKKIAMLYKTLGYEMTIKVLGLYLKRKKF